MKLNRLVPVVDAVIYMITTDGELVFQNELTGMYGPSGRSLWDIRQLASAEVLGIRPMARIPGTTDYPVFGVRPTHVPADCRDRIEVTLDLQIPKVVFKKHYHGITVGRRYKVRDYDPLFGTVITIEKDDRGFRGVTFYHAEWEFAD